MTNLNNNPQITALYDEQTDLISSRWPTFWRDVEHAILNVTVEYVENGEQSTFIVDGIHLSSSFDRRKEAELQASLIPETADQAWVYGCGTGDLPRVLLQRKNLQILNVVLLNKAVFRVGLAYFDHRDWMCDPRVRFHTAEKQEHINVPMCSAAACLRVAESTAERIRDQVVLELATPYINQGIRENNTYISQIRQNTDLLKSDADVTDLFDIKAGATFYVIGAGPTLSDGYEYIKNRSNDIVVIAVDAALKPLFENGIVPDFVLGIDPDRDMMLAYLDFFNENMKNTPLVYFPIVHRDVLHHWKGPRYAAYSNSPIYEEVSLISPKSRLFSAGTVLHPAIDLAVKMGAKHIELFGADFSYPTGRTHVTGATFCESIEETAAQAWVRNGKGEKIPSIANLVGYLRDLERYIANHPNVHFHNTSQKGAEIQGTDYIEV
jgi:hypothetical protein